MRSYRKDSTSVMHTSAECSELAFILPSIVQRVINTCMEWAAESDVHRTKTNLAISAQGNFVHSNFRFHVKLSIPQTKRILLCILQAIIIVSSCVGQVIPAV